MASMINHINDSFEPRDYQREVVRALFIENKKRFINIFHRRAGKDLLWFNLLVPMAIERIGTYVHALPTQVQARKVIWDGIQKDGTRFIDCIPQELVQSTEKQSMSIYLKNGSIIRMGGTDNYNALMGTNPLHVTFSEYSLCNPIAWDYIRPILLENNGTAAFIYTPRGENHGYNLLEQNRDNPKWFTSIKTIDDTKDINGNPIISEEMLQEERNSGMSDEMINQEFYCSFTTPQQGTIFKEELMFINKNEHYRPFEVDPRVPVHTCWDIGINDTTAIWLIQEYREHPLAIAYYENNNKSIMHYFEWLKDFKDKFGIIYDNHFAPHDIEKRELGSGKNLKQIARESGWILQTVPRIQHKQDGIEALRSTLKRLRINSTYCKQGFSCLKQYHSNETTGKPEHDWSSNGVDALMQYAQVVDKIRKDKRKIIVKNRNAFRL